MNDKTLPNKIPSVQYLAPELYLELVTAIEDYRSTTEVVKAKDAKEQLMIILAKIHPEGPYRATGDKQDNNFNSFYVYKGEEKISRFATLEEAVKIANLLNATSVPDVEQPNTLAKPEARPLVRPFYRITTTLEIEVGKPHVVINSLSFEEMLKKDLMRSLQGDNFFVRMTVRETNDASDFLTIQGNNNDMLRQLAILAETYDRIVENNRDDAGAFSKKYETFYIIENLRVNMTPQEIKDIVFGGKNEKAVTAPLMKTFTVTFIPSTSDRDQLPRALNAFSMKELLDKIVIVLIGDHQYSGLIMKGSSVFRQDKYEAFLTMNSTNAVMADAIRWLKAVYEYKFEAKEDDPKTTNQHWLEDFIMGKLIDGKTPKELWTETFHPQPEVVEVDPKVPRHFCFYTKDGTGNLRFHFGVTLEKFFTGLLPMYEPSSWSLTTLSSTANGGKETWLDIRGMEIHDQVKELKKGWELLTQNQELLKMEVGDIDDYVVKTVYGGSCENFLKSVEQLIDDAMAPSKKESQAMDISEEPQLDPDLFSVVMDNNQGQRTKFSNYTLDDILCILFPSCVVNQPVPYVFGLEILQNGEEKPVLSVSGEHTNSFIPHLTEGWKKLKDNMGLLGMGMADMQDYFVQEMEKDQSVGFTLSYLAGVNKLIADAERKKETASREATQKAAAVAVGLTPAHRVAFYERMSDGTKGAMTVSHSGNAFGELFNDVLSCRTNPAHTKIYILEIEDVRNNRVFYRCEGTYIELDRDLRDLWGEYFAPLKEHAIVQSWEPGVLEAYFIKIMELQPAGNQGEDKERNRPAKSWLKPIPLKGTTAMAVIEAEERNMRCAANQL